MESLLTTVDYNYPNFHLTMQCYICKVKSGNLTLLEHEAAKWLTRGELSSVNFISWHGVCEIQNTTKPFCQKSLLIKIGIYGKD